MTTFNLCNYVQLYRLHYLSTNAYSGFVMQLLQMKANAIVEA